MKLTGVSLKLTALGGRPSWPPRTRYVHFPILPLRKSFQGLLSTKRSGQRYLHSRSLNLPFPVGPTELQDSPKTPWSLSRRRKSLTQNNLLLSWPLSCFHPPSTVSSWDWTKHQNSTASSPTCTLDGVPTSVNFSLYFRSPSLIRQLELPQTIPAGPQAGPFCADTLDNLRLFLNFSKSRFFINLPKPQPHLTSHPILYHLVNYLQIALFSPPPRPNVRLLMRFRSITSFLPHFLWTSRFHTFATHRGSPSQRSRKWALVRALRSHQLPEALY